VRSGKLKKKIERDKREMRDKSHFFGGNSGLSKSRIECSFFYSKKKKIIIILFNY
jgi:hypothetical protein